MPILKPKLQSDEQGFASLVIAIILILILSLITVGFAQLMQREQRQALDKQLSSQAYYAAESGINDATRAINAGLFQANPTIKQNCGPLTSGPGAAYFSKNTIGSSTGASYPCLTVDPSPLDLQYGSISTTLSKVVEVQGVDPTTNAPTNISKLEISWQDAGTSQQFANDCSAFYPAAGGSPNWNATGILRAELIPINNLDRNDLIANSYTGFFCPLNDAATGQLGTSDYGSHLGDASGTVINGDCNSGNPAASPSGVAIPKTPLYCNAEITGLSQSSYYLAIHSIYNPVTVTITAYSDTEQLGINDAQTVVDSTGKAQDETRRIQVRVPSVNNYDYADFDLESAGSICKQLDLTPNTNDGPVCANSY